MSPYLSHKYIILSADKSLCKYAPKNPLKSDQVEEL